MGRRSDELNSATELDLVPIMNMVTILIPFLLLSVSFVTLAAIDATAPSVKPDKSTQTDEDPTQQATVTVAVGATGMKVFADGLESGENFIRVVPCKGKTCDRLTDYDLGGLTDTLSELKEDLPDKEDLILAPDEDLAFEVLIAVMDASRLDPHRLQADGSPSDLFPAVVISGGAMSL